MGVGVQLADVRRQIAAVAGGALPEGRGPDYSKHLQEALEVYLQDTATAVRTGAWLQASRLPPPSRLPAFAPPARLSLCVETIGGSYASKFFSIVGAVLGYLRPRLTVFIRGPW